MMGTHPAIDLDVKEAAECGLFSAPELLARKRGPELERFNARVAALGGRATLDLRASIEVCSDPGMLWALHEELMRRGIPPVLRGPRPWHLGTQGRVIEFAADLAWLGAVHPGLRARHGLAKAILKTRLGSDEWWRLVLRQFGRSGSGRGLVLALGLAEPQRLHLRTLRTAAGARLFERLHGQGFGLLVGELETALRQSPDKSGQTDPRTTATRRAQLWRVHRLLGAGAAETARTWAELSGEVLTRQQTHKQLVATAAVALPFERGSLDAPA